MTTNTVSINRDYLTSNIPQIHNTSVYEEGVSNDTISNVFPPFLLEYGELSEWQYFHLVDFWQNSISQEAKNLALKNKLESNHHTNVIFEHVQAFLPDKGLFAFSVVTSENIKNAILKKNRKSIFRIYYFFRFVFFRVMPKIKIFTKICQFLNIQADISKAEILGRLIYFGFEIVGIKEINNETIVISKKNLKNKPFETNPTPNEGLLFKMKRTGENGRPIFVYKFRSMHPYSEYIQEYLHNQNGIELGGKFKNDYRISTGGRILRKYWIDEIPMIYNLLVGDIKLVGVRPLSEHYFNLYSDELKACRIKHKPGLIPPFYADMPNTFDEILISEKKYLDAYEKSPFATDCKYLSRILVNIFFKNARSR